MQCKIAKGQRIKGGKSWGVRCIRGRMMWLAKKDGKVDNDGEAGKKVGVQKDTSDKDKLRAL